MKTTIRKSTTSTTGYEIVFGDTVLPIDKTYPNEPFTLVLPENPSNRKYFNSKKVDNAGGEIELDYKESKKFGPRAAQKPLEEYMTEDELELKAKYEAMMKDVEARRQADLEAKKEEKTRSKEERLREQLKKLEDKLAALRA